MICCILGCISWIGTTGGSECLCCCSTKKKEKGGFLFKIKGRVKQKIWRQREGNKQGEGWRVRTDKQAGRLGYRSEGLSADGWADEVMESSLLPADRTSRGARGGSEPSPGAAAQPRVSLLQTPPLISTQLASGSICCLEWHTNTRAHTPTSAQKHEYSCSHRCVRTHTHAHCFHYP